MTQDKSKKSSTGAYKFKFIRHHDLGLETGEVSNYHDKKKGSPIFGLQPTIFQIRNPLESITSLYRLRWGKGGKNQDLEQTPKSWQAFALNCIQWWKKFSRIWWIDNSNTGKILLDYHKTIENPFREYARVLEFMHIPVQMQLRWAIEKIQVQPKNNFRDFKFFDRATYGALEKMALLEIKELGLRRHFH